MSMEINTEFFKDCKEEAIRQHKNIEFHLVLNLYRYPQFKDLRNLNFLDLYIKSGIKHGLDELNAGAYKLTGYEILCKFLESLSKDDIILIKNSKEQISKEKMLKVLEECFSQAVKNNTGCKEEYSKIRDMYFNKRKEERIEYKIGTLKDDACTISHTDRSKTKSYRKENSYYMNTTKINISEGAIVKKSNIKGIKNRNTNNGTLSDTISRLLKNFNHSIARQEGQIV